MGYMTYDSMLRLIKDGYLAKRKDWCGKFILMEYRSSYIPPYDMPTAYGIGLAVPYYNKSAFASHCLDLDDVNRNNPKVNLPFVYVKYNTGKEIPYFPSNEDKTSDDWILIDKCCVKKCMNLEDFCCK